MSAEPAAGAGPNRPEPESSGIAADVLERGVGPCLQPTAIGRAIIAAIEEQNEGTVLDDEGAYIRVFSPGVCRVTREAVEENLGRAVNFPGDLEVIMSSFAGKLAMNEFGATWWLAHEPQPELPH
jgi:toluene monooxygenase system protein D